MAVKASDFDFGGYATRYNVQCSDGRKILPGAFAHSNGAKLPLVWQHLHDDPGNVLGHVVLEHREDGVYVYGTFNKTVAGQNAKVLVQNGDVEAMSIYANQLNEKNKIVHGGKIREVSLVLSGANPGATIDHINLQHADGSEDEIEDEAIIYSGEPLDINLEHSEEKEEMPKKSEDEILDEVLEHAAEGKTVGEIFNTLTEEQKTAVYALISAAMEDSAMSQSDEEGETFMKKNVFDNSDEKDSKQVTLSHSDMEAIFADARQSGSLRAAVEQFALEHAGTYGIDDIGYLFPDARAVTGTPEWLKRDTTWVQGWMSGTRHLPFSRVKSWYADITADEARAKGYVTGDQKIEEVFPILKRTTDPTTIYKKQKLDRDDVLDITDFSVVSWMKSEMRFMLDEEVARAALVGDGRTFGVDSDAVDPSKIRPILGDDAVYVEYITLDVAVVDYADIIDDFIAARGAYKGAGQPNMYVAPDILVNFLLLKDTTGRRIYKSVDELARELRVRNIIEVELLTGVQRDNAAPAFTADTLAIFVNPSDYCYGADKGGNVGMFDDFDIDYNQYKYLIETRASGALVKPKTAMVLERKTA